MSKQLRKCLPNHAQTAAESKDVKMAAELWKWLRRSKIPKECSVTVPEPKVQIVRQQSLSFCRPMGEDFASICSAGSASKFTTRRDSTPTGPLPNSRGRRPIRPIASAASCPGKLSKKTKKMSCQHTRHGKLSPMAFGAVFL